MPSLKTLPMKHLLSAALILLQGCALLPYPFDQWEYPSPKLEAMVEQTQPVARLTTAEFHESWMRYRNQVVEVTGAITHIINKGGAAGLMLDGDWASCSFGRKQKPMVGRLRVGQLATFRGLVHPQSKKVLNTCILISPD
jgi:hypothetical protein